MTLRIDAVADDTLELWRDIHNRIIPTSPLSPEEVAERATRNRLTLAHDGETTVGNATIRPPAAGSSTATVIVRVLPEFRRRGHGSAYLAAMVAEARTLGATRIETVVWAPNQDGLDFARARGFVEFERYTLEGDTTEFVGLYLGA